MSRLGRGAIDETTTLLTFDAFDVITGSRIDSDDVAHVYENGSQEFAAGFDFYRFGDVCRRVAFGTWFAVFDFKFDVVGW